MVSVPEVSGTREEVLTQIRTAAVPPTVEEIATALGLHRNSVRLHAAALQDAGLVEQDTRPTGGRGRPLTVYAPTARGTRAGARNYEVLAEVLVDDIAETQEDPVARANLAGRRWGRRLAADREASDELVSTVLAELGFEPDDLGATIDLRNCPFRELVDSHQGLVCSLHAGMIQGMAGDDDLRLLPFTSPNTCTVHLTHG